MPISVEESPLVLLMDRRETDAKLITSILEKAGFHVFASSDRAAAINLCRSAEHSVQLAIIDTTLSGIHTAELLEQIRQVNPAIRVLLMTSPDDQESPRIAPTAVNVHGRLTRPFRRAQLLGSVLDMVRQPLVRTA